ncbi:MAG: hypothetical protein P8P81_01780 [Bacteroidia bacterium]|nr:hypothetical protein [Bacteroidia bacterium]
MHTLCYQHNTTQHNTTVSLALILLLFCFSSLAQTDGQVLTRVNGGASWADPSGGGIYVGNGTTPTYIEVDVLDSIEFNDGTLFLSATDNRVGINEDEPNSTFHANGSVAYAVDEFVATTSSTNYDMDETNYLLLVNTTNADANITLPAASTCEGRVYHVIKTKASNSLIFTRNIFTAPSTTVNSFSGTNVQVRIISAGGQWRILETRY